MTDLRQAAQAVLNAWNDGECMFEFSLVIEDLDKALAQPEQGPVAWLQIGLGPLHAGDVIARTTKPKKWNPEWWRFEPLYTTPPAAQPEQVDCPRCGHVCSQRPWVGLTDTEIDYQAKKDDHGVYFALGALWAEAKLKEKNT